jgi:hypothetical protein
MNLNRQDSVNAINISEKYNRYCRELDKEDKLLNDRVTWLLVSQSILFAAVQLGGQGPGGNIVEIIARVGCALSVIIWLSVLAAVLSFLRYHSQLKKCCPPANDPDKAYPQVHRSRLNIILGFIAPFVLPIIFFLAWLCIIHACKGS